MVTTDYVKLMAAYTNWQNINLYNAVDSLSDKERNLDRGAFFDSIHATLNHLLWGDQIWLHRLAGLPKPEFLAKLPMPEASSISESKTMFPDWQALRQVRKSTDQAILEWSKCITADDLEGELSWFSGAMQADITRPRWALIIQLFNHGTHHRGQVHAMLTAAGAKPNDTDVPFMPADFYDWS
ncbi:MAG: damage-inducible protein DinB [Pseudomonadales bacterium]|nr:damage-inducible protein DinB [Pseudomonadales bacterium]